MENLKSIISEKVEIRNKSLNGKGFFAKQDINKGEIVFVKGGLVLSLYMCNGVVKVVPCPAPKHIVIKVVYDRINCCVAMH